MGAWQGRRWLARALALALTLGILLAPSPAEALGWRPPAGAPPGGRPGAPVGRRLQEVSPPDWVQQAQAAFEERDPRLRIVAPSDGALLPEGPWTLRLEVADWPLVDAGPLGLGPHLVVQLDGQPPLPTVATELAMPPLSPGSHLLTVYAAKPWGEAHKSPLAVRQIRIHRLAPNPATLPPPGTPQLIAVSPAGPAAPPPLLLDWLLMDAPLQGLRGDASGWRLRLTANGESVLLDQQTPLWLKGWKPGSNALLLELLDGRGELLNPPFNSLLREVVVAGESGSASGRPVPRTPLELAVLLGDQPPSALSPAPDPLPTPVPSPDPPAPSPEIDAAPPAAPEPTAGGPVTAPGFGEGSSPSTAVIPPPLPPPAPPFTPSPPVPAPSPDDPAPSLAPAGAVAPPPTGPEEGTPDGPLSDPSPANASQGLSDRLGE